MANPGDIVYEIGNITLVPKSNQCNVELLVGVLDRNGNTVYHTANLAVSIADADAAALRTAVSAAVVAAAPAFLTGAVPAV